VWDAIHGHVERVIRSHYPADEDVLADEHIAKFWTHFESQFDTPWQLPGLSFSTLVDLLTDLIWWASAGHEQVGSIVEYLTDPRGFHLKLSPGKEVSDVQSFAQGLIVIGLTGLRQPPLMGDWSHISDDSECSSVIYKLARTRSTSAMQSGRRLQGRKSTSP